MYFKPKIFISSVLKLEKIRNELNTFFTNVGAEVILYEKNLTPSVKKATYRQDILESDFVIFIIDSYYGTKTNSGKSGTHEEYEIIKSTKIPSHLYLKQGKTKEKTLAKLKSEIKNSYISYYYYKTENELINKIKHTTFTIAKEIALFKISSLNIPVQDILKISTKNDYAKGIKIIRDIEELNSIANELNLDAISSTIFTNYIEELQIHYNYQKWYFIDEHLDKIFNELLNTFHDFTKLLSNESLAYGKIITITLKSNYKIDIQRLKYENTSRNKRLILKNTLLKFSKKYNNFKKTIIEHKNRADIYS